MRIAAAGGYGVGLTMHVSRFPDPGETLTDGVLASGHGGKGSNQAVAARRLGAEVSLITAVGGDAAGAAAYELWAEEGLDVAGVRRIDAAATMTGFIVVDPSAENCILIAPGALEALTPDDLRGAREQIRGAEAVMVSLEIPLPAAVEALAIARQEGALTVLNPAPARSVPDEVWPDVDILTPNLSEARSLVAGEDTGDADAETVARALHRRTGSTVVLTLGGEGCLIVERGEVVHVPAVPPSGTVDTTGAGDAFTAAFTVAYLETASVTRAARCAVHAGAHAVARAGAVPGMPYREDLPVRP